MNIRVLGKYGRFPQANAGTSSFLVGTDDGSILLDMGCSSLSKLLMFIDITGLSAVVLSHLHGDHIADFKAFTYMASIYKAEGRLKKDIIVYLPATPVNIYNEINSGNGLDYRIIKDGMVEQIGHTEISFYSLKHPIETYGVRLNNRKQILAYTADTLLCDNLAPLIMNADIVIGDACILSKNHKPTSPHLSVKELAVASRENNVKKLILAHLPDYDIDKILREARDQFNDSVLAEEGKEIII